MNSKDTSFTGTSGTLAWELEEQGVENRNRNQHSLLRFLCKHSWLRIFHANDLLGAPDNYVECPLQPEHLQFLLWGGGGPVDNEVSGNGRFQTSPST